MSRFAAALILGGTLAIAVVTAAAITSGVSTTGTSTNITFSQLSIAKPASVSGDILLAGIAVKADATVTPPEGWTLLRRVDNGNNVSLLSFWKAAGNSEPSSYLWTISPQNRAVGGITAYSGVSINNPVDISVGTSGRSRIAVAPSIVTTEADAKIITLFAYDTGLTAANHFATPTGMVEKYDLAYAPLGPSVGSHDALQSIAGSSGTKSSDLGAGPQRNWVAQQIALRPAPLATTAEDFNSYSDGELNGGNGGIGWNSAWTGTTLAQIQGDVVFEGSKAAKVSLPNGVEANIKRTFEQKNTGTLHWVQRKDQGSHGQGIVLYSGDTLALFAQVGSDVGSPGLEWVTTSGSGIAVFDPYTIGNWDTADIEFDSNTDQFRISINNGSFSPWMDFANPVDGIDGIALNFSAAGPETVDMYWDDIRFTN